MHGVAAGLPTKPSVRIAEELYLASAWQLFEQLVSTEPEVIALMVVAHNPGVAELAAKLSGEGDPAALQSLARRFPPAALAELEVPCSSWSALEPGGAKLLAHFIA